jgi:hypothetical protein
MASDKDRLYDNDTERAYAMHLEAERQAGRIEHWWPKPAKFRLAKSDFYEPDFMVQMPDGLICVHETKGFMMEDALQKIKFFVQIYPFPLYVVTKDKARSGYSWKMSLFQP